MPVDAKRERLRQASSRLSLLVNAETMRENGSQSYIPDKRDSMMLTNVVAALAARVEGRGGLETE